MEGAILLGLAGIGYLMNKDDDKEKHRIDTNIQPKVFQNTNSSIYNLNNVKDSQKYESTLLKENFEKTLDNQSNMVSDFNAKLKEVEPQSDLLWV